MGNAFVLRLIRHAPTAGNKRKAYIGWTNEPVLPFIAAPDNSKKLVWGSDLLRCRQTAEILYPNAQYKPDSNFRELHFGDWEKMTYDELKMDAHYRSWIDDPRSVAPPNGESFERLAERIDAAIDRFSETGDFTIITHGGPIRYLLSKATGQSFFSQQALHGHCYTVMWSSKSAYKEGQRCISFSEEPLMANGNT